MEYGQIECKCKTPLTKKHDRSTAECFEDITMLRNSKDELELNMTEDDVDKDLEY